MGFDIKKRNKKILDFIKQIFPGKYFKNFMKINQLLLLLFLSIVILRHILAKN